MAYNCVLDLPTYQVLDCFTYPKSGISGFIIALPGHGITDWSNEVQINAAISLNKARVVGGCDRGVRAEVPAGTPDYIDNPSGCSVAQVLVGYTHTATVEDSNVSATNDAFYALVQTTKDLTIALYLCKEDKMRIITSDVTVASPSMPQIDFSPKVLQKYTLNVQWYVSAGVLASQVTNVPDNLFC